MFTKYDIKNIDLSVLKDNLLSFSYTTLSDEPSFLHSHPLAEIIVPQTDFGNLIVQNETFPMKRDYLYIVNPNVRHTEMKVSQVNETIYFALRINNTILKHDTHQPLFILPMRQAQQEITNHLYYAKKYFEEGNELLASLNLSCFFFIFINLLTQYGYSLRHEKHPRISSLTTEIQHYISNNYARSVQISDICQQFNISHNSLLLRFKKELKLSPKEYLDEVRLNAAIQLLRSSDYTISQVATLCGFDSASYFSYIFRKKIGKTPKQYRATPPPSYIN